MKKKIAIAVVLIALVVGTVLSVRAETGRIVDNSKDLFKYIQLFTDSISLVSADYIEPVEVKDLMYGAIKGMMNTLDGYSQFLDPESFKEITEETKGEFAGIGIQIGIRGRVLTVIAPIEDTPAYNAGVKTDDKIVEIEGETTYNMTLDEAVKMLRGDVGTEVKLTIIREGVDKILYFTIERAIIKLESVKEAKVIEKDIGYIKLVEFQQHSAKDVEKAVKGFHRERAKNLIIDLRGNPGGLLDSAVEVSDLFLEKGDMIVYTEGRDPEKRIEYRSTRGPIQKDMKIAVLVDKGSASAAEIVAGALKDNRQGLIIGVPTFGKGSVQTVIPLKDNSAIRLTTASYFTPSGKNIRDKGIEPDVYSEKITGTVPSEAEEKRPEVFDKLKDDKNPKADKKKKAKEAPKPEQESEKVQYDSQLQTAISILKSLHILENEKTS